MKLRLTSVLLVAACGDNGGSTPPTDSPTDTTGEATIHVSIGDNPNSTYAFQDGDGEWKLAPDRDGETITLTISSDRYAVASTCGGASSLVRVAYRAATETEVALSCSLGEAPAGAITGTITSNADDAHQLLHGTAVDFVFGDTGPVDYTLATEGTSDFVAVREPADGDAIDVFHVERDVAVTDSVTRNLVFSALDAPVLVPQPVPNDTGSVYTGFLPNPDVFQFSLDLVPPFDHTVLPVAKRRSTDRYDVGVIVDLESDSTVQFDAILEVPTAVTAPTTNLLDPLVIEATDGLRVTWNKVANADNVGASVNDENGLAFIGFSPAWEATFTGNLSFEVPDFSSLAGWPADTALRTAPQFVQITSVIENVPFPDDGYEAQVFQRSFSPSSKRLDARSRRTLEKARLHERARARR